MVQMGQEMDEHLDQLAYKCRDMRFLRVFLSRQSCIPPMLGIPHAPGQLKNPMLLQSSHKTPVNYGALQSEGNAHNMCKGKLTGTCLH